MSRGSLLSRLPLPRTMVLGWVVFAVERMASMEEREVVFVKISEALLAVVGYYDLVERFSVAVWSQHSSELARMVVYSL